MSTLTLQFFVIFLIQLGGLYVAEKIRYLSTERPDLTYYNPKWFKYFNATCRRYSRDDPVYYFEVHFETIYICYNNLSVDAHFYQFLSNQYKRSFVEFHFTICDVLQKETFFGSTFKQGGLKGGCPIPVGVFDLYNLSIPPKNIPLNFPFTKGRIYLNLTSTDTKELVLSGHVDMEIKEFKFKRTKTRPYHLI